MRHGFLLLHKPIGPTSHDIVSLIRRTLHEPKVGHLGTLDPLAEGLLVVAVGSKALKVVELFTRLPKEYEASIRFGAVSTTYDAEGVIEEIPLKAGWKPPEDFSAIQAIIDDHFIGKIQQVPPAFSAVHVGGERAYRKAMRGESVEIKARETTIHRCTVGSYAFPHITLTVGCESGTYIRSLAHDLGAKMRCGGYLTALKRTMVGEWSLRSALKPEEAQWTDVLPLKDIVRTFTRLDLSDSQYEDIRNGRQVPGTVKTDVTFGWYGDLPVAILENDKKHEGMLKARKVL